MRKYVPSESPTWNRVDSAHLLRESEVDEGIFQPLVEPPTKKSLASEMLMMEVKRRVRRSNEEAIDERAKKERGEN